MRGRWVPLAWLLRVSGQPPLGSGVDRRLADQSPRSRSPLAVSTVDYYLSTFVSSHSDDVFRMPSYFGRDFAPPIVCAFSNGRSQRGLARTRDAVVDPLFFLWCRR